VRQKFGNPGRTGIAGSPDLQIEIYSLYRVCGEVI